MPLARTLKDLAKKIAGHWDYEFFKRPYLPKGADVYLSLRAHWPQWQPAVIFDVGANVGQTVARLRPLFPTAMIHAFEPVADTFAQLRANTAGDARVQCHRLALAERSGEAWIQLHGSSEHTSLAPGLRGTAGTTGPDVKLTLSTAHEFCTQHGIRRIDLLKIDVEGFELPVLQGAWPLLAQGRIDYIVTEAGLMPGNPRFTPLPAVIDFLRPHGFWLVGVYEQFGLRYTQGAEFCNALFALERHLTRGAG